MATGHPVDEEGRPGVARVEAFSDGVVAIIVTIMVLELHPPLSESMDRLWALWPVFIAYVLSYAYVAIYWVNHHRLFVHATVATNALVWANMILLFTLSLVPFSTAYLGEHHFSRPATWFYLATMILPALAHHWLQAIVHRSGRPDAAAQRYFTRVIRKGRLSTGIYVAGLPLTWISPWLGIGCAAVVAVFWVLPDGPLDRLFGTTPAGQGEA